MSLFNDILRIYLITFVSHLSAFLDFLRIELSMQGSQSGGDK
jgi:hypothetical protein